MRRPRDGSIGRGAKGLRDPELLETILLQLPCLKIFTFQRISKFWKAIIGGSVALQTALWLQPGKLKSPELTVTIDEDETERFHYLQTVPDCYTDASTMR